MEAGNCHYPRPLVKSYNCSTVTERVGRYELLGAVASGGASVVYRAHDSELGRDVALKMLRSTEAQDSDLRRRFAREARAVRGLSHPHIVTFLDAGETGDGLLYLVTEFVEGESLRSALLREGALREGRALEVARQMALALSAAHEAGLLHRDVKPDNVMLAAPDGSVKMLDFGLARRMGANASTANRTRPGTILGSVHYLSPEQARGGEVDVRSDVWSIGAVLFEMLSGAAPFTGNTCVETLVAIVEKPSPGLAAGVASAETAEVVARCLRKGPAERFASAAELADSLSEARAQVERREGAGWLRRLWSRGW